jgi:transposase-like protein
MNVIDKLPKAEQPEATTRVRAIWQAQSESAARKLAAAVIADFRRGGYDRAADCLADDLDRCLTSTSSRRRTGRTCGPRT